MVFKGGTMDYYQILGIKQNAHPVEIDAAHKILKPVADRTGDLEASCAVEMAYRTLISPRLRIKYDNMLALGFTQLPALGMESPALAPPSRPQMISQTRHVPPPPPRPNYEPQSGHNQQQYMPCCRPQKTNPMVAACFWFLAAYVIVFIGVSFAGVIGMLL